MASPDKTLIQKYNVAGPRYTSYPTAVQFCETRKDEAYKIISNEIEWKADTPSGRNLSLYFHIPFCFSLCWYCGCTKIITKNTDRGDSYLDYLEREMDMMTSLIQAGKKVIQIHFGGGTPTFLRPDQLRRLGTLIRKRFTFSDQVEFSVEIDPRRCTSEHIEALQEIGCNRASLGVQDTNADVQEAIHRIQPFAQTADVTQMLREAGINGVNFDLIYGLPRQNTDTFRKTIKDVMTLNPNRLAVYSYAHIPSLMPSQKLLNESELPAAEEKLNMLLLARKDLTECGMKFIGMDHFAREDDSLSLALEQGTLQRNFQGYSTCAGSWTLAFGMSGISQFEYAYFQNTKYLAHYYGALDEGKLPVEKVLDLSTDDRIRRDLIQQIMCRTEMDFTDFSEKWSIRFEDYFEKELAQLDDMEADGLLIKLRNGLKITRTGRLFLRNIAMVFDVYFRRDINKRYSKTV